MSKITLGAPSLSGVGASELVSAEFKDAVFPLKIKVESLVSNSLVFPEVKGLFLSGASASVVVKIQDADELQRLVSSIEQVAEANQFEAILTIESLADVSKKAGKVKAG